MDDRTQKLIEEVDGFVFTMLHPERTADFKIITILHTLGYQEGEKIPFRGYYLNGFFHTDFRTWKQKPPKRKQ